MVYRNKKKNCNSSKTARDSEREDHVAGMDKRMIVHDSRPNNVGATAGKIAELYEDTHSGSGLSFNDFESGDNPENQFRTLCLQLAWIRDLKLEALQ